MAVVRLVGLSLALFYFSPWRKVAGAMVGGISEIDPLAKGVMSAEIDEGVDIYVKKETKDGADFIYKEICGTLRASSQVIQGSLYRVAFEMVPLDKSSSSSHCIEKDTLRKLPVLERGKVKLGCFTIWSRPWMKEKSERFIVTKKDSNDYRSCLEVNSK